MLNNSNTTEDSSTQKIEQEKQTGKNNKCLPVIDNVETAYEVLKQNGWVGYILAGMYFLGILFIFFTDTNASTSQQVSEDERLFEIIGGCAVVALVLFLSWRMKSRNGIVSAILLLLLFIFEIFTKVISGTTNIGWFIFYTFILLGFINSIRAIRYIKMQERLIGR